MEEMEQTKRASKEMDDVSSAEFLSLKRQRETRTAELEDDVMAWFSMEDSETDSMSELWKLLDDSAEAAASTACSSSSLRVRFSDNPYSSTLIFQSSSSYVTINGNEESCGSSFSDLESSVMASVDMGGILSANVKAGRRSSSGSSSSSWEGIKGWSETEAEEGGAWVTSDEEARGWMMDWETEWDEEQLTRFLGEEEEIYREYLF